MHFSINTVLV